MKKKKMDIQTKMIKMSAQFQTDYTSPLIRVSGFFNALRSRDTSSYDDVCRLNNQSQLYKLYFNANAEGNM